MDGWMDRLHYTVTKRNIWLVRPKGIQSIRCFSTVFVYTPILDSNAWHVGGLMKRSWERIGHDEKDGKLYANAEDSLEEQRRCHAAALQKSSVPRNIRRGVIRYLHIIVDMSSAVNDTDMQPSRLQAIKNALKTFALNFSDQNPLSELALIQTRDQTAEKSLSFTDDKSAEKLDVLLGGKKGDCLGLSGSGQPSLQNALLLALDQIKKLVPPYGTREILLVQNALCTNDPSDICETIALLKEAKVVVNIIGLGAEVFICKKIAADTGGTYHVAIDQSRMSALFDMVQIPPALQSTKNNFAQRIAVGFPKEQRGREWAFTTPNNRFSSDWKECPRCLSATDADLPWHCDVCRLFLISSPHLCRSYHHIFGVEKFAEISPVPGRACYCCGVSLDGLLQMQCPGCKNTFSADCDVFIHEKLHNCPGCWNVE